jgi:uncharacterized protein (DUF1499 family)
MLTSAKAITKRHRLSLDITRASTHVEPLLIPFSEKNEMSKVAGRIAIVVLGIMVAAILAGQCGLWRGGTPADLGIKSGRLKPPSFTANSVSSQATLYPDHPQKDTAHITPLSYSGSGEMAMKRIGEILQRSARTEIIHQDSTYIYAQCTTPLMRFTDDLEFWLDEAQGVIQVRSASRLGSKDLGVNRQRVEAIRAQFLKN